MKLTFGTDGLFTVVTSSTRFFFGMIFTKHFIFHKIPAFTALGCFLKNIQVYLSAVTQFTAAAAFQNTPR
jgi:hypothetical protein